MQLCIDASSISGTSGTNVIGRTEDIYIGFGDGCDPVIFSEVSSLIYISVHKDAGCTPGMITDAEILVTVRKEDGNVKGSLTIECRGSVTKYHYNITFPEVRILQRLDCRWANETVHMRITHH